jgi:hypothetical protein
MADSGSPRTATIEAPPPKDVVTEPTAVDPESQYLYGFKFIFAFSCLCIILFLVVLVSHVAPRQSQNTSPIDPSISRLPRLSSV